MTKTFGGAAGRSELESSKDGQVFTMEEKARSVDEKLRVLLRWGLATPGGKGRTAVPESFLTHVLLADQAQDSVRKILFEPRLDKDPDESGRERLVAALGALAQEPLFKSILDQATESMQRAFTPKGQRKRSAGSPWLEASERIKAMQARKAQLEAQVKETALVEARIKDLHGHHCSVTGELTEAEEAHRAAVRQLEARKEHDVLDGEVQSRKQMIRSAEVMVTQIEIASGGAAKLESDAVAAREDAKQAAGRLAQVEIELNTLRRRLDTALHDDPDTERRMADLQAEVGRTDSQVRNALAAVGAAKDALRAAGKLAADLVAEDAAAQKTLVIADSADATAAVASREVERVRKALTDAQDRQRLARSEDRAQARELRRKALENQALSLSNKRSRIESALQRAQQVGQMSAHRVSAQAAMRAARDELTVARGENAADEAEHEKLEATRGQIVRLQAYGRLHQLREELAKATQAREEAERERRHAAELRAYAANLQREVRAGLPAVEQIQELDRLYQRLQVAEAALGGGLSVEIRPKRTLTVLATRDGATDQGTTGSEQIVLTAKRSVSFAIDDWLDVVITAGEEAARRTAADLRARWLREGEPVLVEYGAASLDELRLAHAGRDATLREIFETVREAENAEQRASLISDVDVATVRDQIAAAESELGAADCEDLATRFARLETSWQTGLRTRSLELEAQLASSRSRLAQKRAGVAKLEAKLEVQQVETARCEVEVERAQLELAGPWAVVVESCEVDQQTLDVEQQDIERRISELDTSSSEEENAADAAVADAATALQAAEANAKVKQNAARAARVAHVQSSTRLDGSRSIARQFDSHGIWASLLDRGDASLPVDAWEAAVRDAEADFERARAAHMDATVALTDARVAHDATVQSLRKKVQDADNTSRQARSRSDAAEALHKELIAQHSATVVSLSELKVKVAGIHVDELRAEIAKRRTRMLELEPKRGDVDEADVAALEQKCGRLRRELRDLDEELAKARGALEHVGGAVVRERLVEIGQAIRQAEQREHEVEVEYEAWRLLHDTLRQAESMESAHLGRALAGPVGVRFRQLTGGRYGDIEIGAKLETGGIHVAGELRQIAELSAGTQDQLATLLRVCIAQQLQSAIILDDHLTHSDPARVAWFNTMLREAAENVQIILITCRPQEVLAPDEVCTSGRRHRASADGRVHAVDLAAVIRRFELARPASLAPALREA